ncbi:outer membrane efflux protein [Candidatus Magnetobacterium bavaricum]|uniref:Outer membrane efflux protein n=1 Tax=Candidatus Magnetobacterium bavaricum TaxID=29290 RepID=A0A0F3H034_9BACT|nr:outer membrane efflux protein [Candidatus Magnetobacterium bavaricum]
MTCWFSCVSLLMPVNGFSADVGLREAIGIALKENHRIKALTFSRDASGNDVEIARGNLLPKVTFEENIMRTNNPTYYFMSKLNQSRFSQQDFEISALNHPNPINNYRTNLEFEMPLFSRKAYLGIDIAKDTLDGKRHELERVRESVTLDVVKAYVGVKTSGAYIEVSNKAIEDTLEHLRIAKVRYDTGVGTYADVLRAQVSVSEAESRLAGAQKNLNSSKRFLGLIIGSSESYGIVDEDIIIELLPYEEYNAGAAKRADVLSMEKNNETAKKMIKMAQAEYLPVIGVGGNYQLNDRNVPLGSDGDSYQFMAFMRLNIFDGLKREHEVAKARYKANEAAEYLEGLRKQAGFEVYDAYLGVIESEKKLALSLDALSAAEEGLRLTAKRYANAMAPMVSLLDVQAATDKARADVAAARGQHLIALATLEFYAGRILNVFEIRRR